jgi:hypothetical protein
MACYGDSFTFTEIPAAIRFLLAKTRVMRMSIMNYMRVLDQNIMSEGTERQWCKMFKEGQGTDAHDEEQRGAPVICS